MSISSNFLLRNDLGTVYLFVYAPVFLCASAVSRTRILTTLNSSYIWRYFHLGPISRSPMRIPYPTSVSGFFRDSFNWRACKLMIITWGFLVDLSKAKTL